MVIQQNSSKLLMMDILMSETRWAHKKWNKLASDIKLVFYSSTITMIHGPKKHSFWVQISNYASMKWIIWCRRVGYIFARYHFVFMLEDGRCQYFHNTAECILKHTVTVPRRKYLNAPCSHNFYNETNTKAVLMFLKPVSIPVTWETLT